VNAKSIEVNKASKCNIQEFRTDFMCEVTKIENKEINKHVQLIQDYSIFKGMKFMLPE
jgi:hypothetical protein